jgi:hypothetical protein
MGVYLAGALVCCFFKRKCPYAQLQLLLLLLFFQKFALANWTFLDAAILSAHAKSPWGSPPNSEAPVHVTFVDWIPGICSLIGYLIINLIDKDRVRGNEGFGDSNAVWRARLFLFIGFAFMAGGLAGSVVCSFFF